MAEYGGLFGAFAFALRQSESWVLRSYVVTSAITGVYVAVLLTLGLVTWLGNPTGRIGEFALLGVAVMFVLVPLFAPVLIVARRRRHDDERPRVELGLGLAGYAFLASIFVGLLISDPSDHGGALGAIDALPQVYGLVPPVLAAAVIAGLAWYTR